MSEDTRAEMTRQLIGLAGLVAVAFAATWAERKASEPAGLRTLRMRAARAAESAAARAAVQFGLWAEAAHRAYERDCA